MNRIEPAQLAALFHKPQVPAAPAGGTAPAAGAGFGEALRSALASVDRAQVNAEDLARRFQENDPAVSLERTMIAMTQANLSFQGLVQTRNRFVQAYQDIMNMQV